MIVGSWDLADVSLHGLAAASSQPPGTTSSQPVGNIRSHAGAPQPGGSGVTIINPTVIHPTQPFVISANQTGGPQGGAAGQPSSV